MLNGAVFRMLSLSFVIFTIRCNTQYNKKFYTAINLSLLTIITVHHFKMYTMSRKPVKYLRNCITISYLILKELCSLCYRLESIYSKLLFFV